MIGIIDYGSGNFASVHNALQLLTKDIIAITNKDTLGKCSHIILPGVGSFGAAMSKLENMDILGSLYECVIVKKVPFLGICVGMQILADLGHEFGEHKGLGYIKGEVSKLDIDKNTYSLPHMGWNNLTNMSNSPLFDNIDENATFYFVHSYYFKVDEKKVKTVNTFYGKEFVAAFSFENMHAVQFHPEKSQLYGLKVLDNFIKLK
jgi:glutamine amidotransferase